MDWKEKAQREAYSLIGAINEIFYSNIFEDKNDELFWWDEDNLADHLRERKERGHLAESETVYDYNCIIERILTDNPQIGLHPKYTDRYLFGGSIKEGERWIVSMSKDRYVITAFKADTFDDYAKCFPVEPSSDGNCSLGTYEELKEKYESEEE